jgi:group II intron reverse transcriptase/maturase
MNDTSGSANVSTKLQRIAELARKAPEMVLTTLAHHIDIEFLREAYRRTRKDGAAGVDGKTAEQYEKDLEANLQSLLERFKSGTYKAPPVRRVYIPKGDGSKTRPIGIPTFEDKVLQRAVHMVLEAVYEEDFYYFSFGFRPKRNAHHALAYLWKELMEMGGGWVLDLDIKGYFDAIVHGHLRAFLDQRVRDGVLRRAIDKWLKAGVLENGQLSRSETGSPQGGVVSPILANVYLHEVLDKWFEREVKPCLKGKAFLVRFADDAVIVFSSEEDARRVLDVLPKRFGKYGLTLHPEKTQLVPFRRPVRNSRGKGKDQGGRHPGNFDLLGFTHFWARSRKGNWVVKRQTAISRFARAVKRVYEWCRSNRHQKVKEQHAALKRKLEGHYSYYGITGNSYALSRFQWEVTRAWRKWLNRRSQRRTMPWEKFKLLLKHLPLPPARCVHSVVRQAANP